MNGMQIFTYNDTPIRTVEQDGELWWVLVDVCRVLEIGNPRAAAERMDEDEVIKTDAIDSMGRPQSVNAVNEPGLYSLILRSNKPEAKAFKRWVTHEVLPSIRRRGEYRVEQKQRPLTQEEWLRVAQIVATCKRSAFQQMRYALAQAGVILPDCEEEQRIASRSPAQRLSDEACDLLRVGKEEYGLPIAEIARRCGVMRCNMYRYINGRGIEDPERAKKIIKTVKAMMNETDKLLSR